jgi:hypothetical protein
MVGILGRVIRPSQGFYLHRTTQHRKTRDEHPCLERDSNPWSQQPTGQDPRLRPHGHCDRPLYSVVGTFPYDAVYVPVLNVIRDPHCPCLQLVTYKTLSYRNCRLHIRTIFHVRSTSSSSVIAIKRRAKHGFRAHHSLSKCSYITYGVIEKPRNPFSIYLWLQFNTFRLD